MIFFFNQMTTEHRKYIIYTIPKMYGFTDKNRENQKNYWNIPRILPYSNVSKSCRWNGSLNPDQIVQSDLGLHGLPRLVCVKI